MSNKRKSAADHVDTHRRLLFTTMFLLSLVFGVKVAFYLATPDQVEYLRLAGKILAALAVVTLIVTIYWKLRYIPGSERFQLLTSSDSFVAQVMNRACRMSWVLTFVLIMFISTTTSRNESTYPAEFYLNLVTFFMLAVFSIGFFVMFHSNGEGRNQEAGL